MSALSASCRRKLRDALREDVGAGDVTSNLLVPAKATAEAVIVAKEPGILCGSDAAREIFRLAGPRLRLKFFLCDGASFNRGRRVMSVQGNLRAILAAERTALNLLGHLSGIATRTRVLAQRLKGTGVNVLDTRKTTPLWRELEKYAVRTGGGKNHRFGLADEIFVKENHRLCGQLGRLRPSARRFVIEVRDRKELSEALMLRPRVILFDNFTPAALAAAVKIARKADPRVLLEASGGITPENVRHYAAAGIDQVSSGSLTHSVKAVDFSLLLRA